MKSSIFIPNRINVGYKKRESTYTGKLAYVVYFDEKGKLRKEKSWQDWRDKTIPNDEFDNAPTSGFVLNKKVGDYSTGWSHRRSYCRVYDPRGFEIEISIENLLYILENTSAIKGKGLEGEFVYGWDGMELVLIPIGAPEYKECQHFSNLVHNNDTIKGKDLVLGGTYFDKSKTEYIYLGKYDYWKTEKIDREDKVEWNRRVDHTWDIARSKATKGFNKGKHFFFASISADNTCKFYAFKALGNKLVGCKDNTCHPHYAKLMDKLVANPIFSPVNKDGYSFIPITFDEFKQLITSKVKRLESTRITASDMVRYKISCAVDEANNKVMAGLYKCTVEYDNYYNPLESVPRGSNPKTVRVPVTIEELYNILQPIRRNSYLENGKLYCKEWIW